MYQPLKTQGNKNIRPLPKKILLFNFGRKNLFVQSGQAPNHCQSHSNQPTLDCLTVKVANYSHGLSVCLFFLSFAFSPFLFVCFILFLFLSLSLSLSLPPPLSLLLCISISFQVLAAPESWPKHFFSAIFKLFCVTLRREITEKGLKEQKFLKTAEIHNTLSRLIKKYIYHFFCI